MFFGRIFRELAAQKVDYVAIGGVAVNLHGYLRNTADLDIVLALSDREIEKFVNVVKKLGLVPRIPVPIEDFARAEKRKEWIEEKNMLVFSVYNPQNPVEHIDVKIDKEEEIGELLSSRVWMKAGTIDIPVVGLDCLIKMKEQTGRGRDKIDAEALKRLREIKNEKK